MEYVLNYSSGFGYIGEGRNGGIYENEIVIIFCGIVGIVDILIDLYCGMMVGLNYKVVYVGFNCIFEFIKL